MRNEQRCLVTGLVLIAIAVVLVSFVPFTSESVEVATTEGYKPYCASPRLHNKTKLVFVVIDALRLSFLTGRSDMRFTKNSLKEGNATLFDATARMPTVTLPRITAFLTGTLSQFGTVLTNLASSEMKTDNWVKIAVDGGKRVRFYGDDTWLKLFPSEFSDYEGVVSFFVNDFTHVDEIVLKNWKRSMKEREDWDVMILHFLGLDHIGHSLGGTSSEIGKKLKMMDSFLEETKKTLEEDEDWMLMAVGDHGMTEAGSHGGASYEESHVPIVIWSSRMKSQMAEIRHPSSSYGISLMSQIDSDEADVFNDLKAMKYHFEQESEDSDCDGLTEKIRKLRRKNLPKWKAIQREMIEKSAGFSTSSVFLAILILIVAVRLQLRYCHRLEVPAALLVFPLLSVFSSSNVEEEHEIWYFLTTTVIVYYAWTEKRPDSLVLAVLHRIGMEWTMKGRRRWIMDPDLLPPPIFQETPLHVDLGFTKSAIFKVVLSIALVWALGLKRSSGFSKWTSFAVFSVATVQTTYFRGHAVLCNVIRLLLIPMIKLNLPTFFLTLSVMVSTPNNVLLILVLLLASRRIQNPLTALFLINSSFFYQGNSNSLSTLDLSSAYTGVTEYNAFLVGFQLVVNTYTGPIVILSTISKDIRVQTVRLMCLYRLVSLILSLFSFAHFSSHLFVWSVFAPKTVYELSHCALAVVLNQFVKE